MEVRVGVTFGPSKILLKHVDCPENKEGPRVNVKICFSSRQITTQVKGSPSLHIKYELKLDEHRKIERAELTSQIHGNFKLTNSHCLTPTIQVKSCIQDFLNPIELKVDYTGEGLAPPNEPAPILQSGNTGTFQGNLPFEKECGEDNICKDHLKVKLEIIGAQFIVVAGYSTFTLAVTLENTNENSYFTVLTYRVPTGLTFRKTSIISAKRRSHVECDDSNNGKYAAVGVIACKVNHPIFRSNATVRFNTTFDVASDVEWRSTEQISINATR
ncbi:integrin alpha-M-like [Rhincodon typus]|uniref:integrin alpha-M-like n=1 Tax=Rhincodon typus TaxID=259920 RepID=UPI00202EE4E4|nr:integrin alpha-M-like [Rhincodon typus]